MIIGLPRSGTTWMANWLTYEDCYCLHDPLNKLHYEDWDTDTKYFPEDSLPLFKGVSCTGIWRWPEWVNAHPAKKLIIERPMVDVKDSLTAKGFEMDLTNHLSLYDIEGPRIKYNDIFVPDVARNVWEYLIGTRFDDRRYKMLREMHIEPEFKQVYRSSDVAMRLHKEDN